MKLSAAFLLLAVTGAQAETNWPPKPFWPDDYAEVILTDTQCLMQTIPGFDPQVLTPLQVARLQAVFVEADGSGFAPQHRSTPISARP